MEKGDIGEEEKKNARKSRKALGSAIIGRRLLHLRGVCSRESAHLNSGIFDLERSAQMAMLSTLHEHISQQVPAPRLP